MLWRDSPCMVAFLERPRLCSKKKKKKKRRKKKRKKKLDSSFHFWSIFTKENGEEEERHFYQLTVAKEYDSRGEGNLRWTEAAKGRQRIRVYSKINDGPPQDQCTNCETGNFCNNLTLIVTTFLLLQHLSFHFQPAYEISNVSVIGTPHFVTVTCQQKQLPCQQQGMKTCSCTDFHRMWVG